MVIQLKSNDTISSTVSVILPKCWLVYRVFIYMSFLPKCCSVKHQVEMVHQWFKGTLCDLSGVNNFCNKWKVQLTACSRGPSRISQVYINDQRCSVLCNISKIMIEGSNRRLAIQLLLCLRYFHYHLQFQTSNIMWLEVGFEGTKSI